MKDENFERIEHIQQHIEASNYAMYEASQTLIYNEMCDLVAWKSFVGKMWAEYRRELSAAKVSAYQNLIASQRAVKLEIPVSIAKDYVACKCGDLQYRVDFADRVNANIGYSLECLRSVLSALKQEMQTMNYAGNSQQQ
jgi:hypothetical protein